MAEAALSAKSELLRGYLPAQRRERGIALVEGHALLEPALAGGWAVDRVFLADDEPPEQAAAVASLCRRVGGTATLVTRAAMERIAAVRAAPGVAVAVQVPPLMELRADADLDWPLLVLDGIADPGNAGTLLRSAAAFGFAVAFAGEGVWHGNEKVLRASAGYAMRKGLIAGRLDPSALPADLPVLALMPGGGGDVGDFARAGLRRFALVVGNESTGLDPARWPTATPLRIDMPGGTESLNAAVSGSIAMHALRVAKRA